MEQLCLIFWLKFRWDPQAPIAIVSKPRFTPRCHLLKLRGRIQYRFLRKLANEHHYHDFEFPLATGSFPEIPQTPQTTPRLNELDCQLGSQMLTSSRLNRMLRAWHWVVCKALLAQIMSRSTVRLVPHLNSLEEDAKIPPLHHLTPKFMMDWQEVFDVLQPIVTTRSRTWLHERIQSAEVYNFL